MVSRSVILQKLADCIEHGKADQQSAFPPRMRDEDGAVEWTRRALEASFTAQEILGLGLTVGMGRIGERFSRQQAYVPDLLFSAKAMNAAMEVLQPHLASGALVHRGTMIVGTVVGDIHEIGKNIVRLVLEGSGWEVIDLGVDVTTEKFLAALDERPGSMLGMSALLTTTMTNMERSVGEVKKAHPDTRIYVGGAPVTPEFSDGIGADGSFPDPYSLVRHLAEAAN